MASTTSWGNPNISESLRGMKKPYVNQGKEVLRLAAMDMDTAKVISGSSLNSLLGLSSGIGSRRF